MEPPLFEYDGTGDIRRLISPQGYVDLVKPFMIEVSVVTTDVWVQIPLLEIYLHSYGVTDSTREYESLSQDAISCRNTFFYNRMKPNKSRRMIWDHEI